MSVTEGWRLDRGIGDTIEMGDKKREKHLKP